jgi:integrase
MPTYSCKIDRQQIEKFTKHQRVSGERVTLADTVCSGLKLVINSQSASWVYTYRKRGYLDGGKRHPQRAMKLGDPVIMTPSEARLAAENVKAQVRAGEDPAVRDRQAERERLAQEARRKTCSQLLEQYAGFRAQKGSAQHIRDEIRNVRFALRELSVDELFPEEITPKHFRTLADMHITRPATAKHRFGALSRFFDFLLDEDIVSANPAAMVSKNRRPKPSSPRVGFYSSKQLLALWNAQGLKPEYLRYLRFMITTPIRAGTGANLRWQQVDLERKELVFASVETKNDEHFTLPISDLAIELLGFGQQVPQDLVFRLSSKEGSPMRAWSYFYKRVREASGVSNFIMHDLRRTFLTQMSEHTGVAEPVLDRMLNHKQSSTRGGVMRHYQQAKYVLKSRDVIKQWEELLREWIDVEVGPA